MEGITNGAVTVDDLFFRAIHESGHAVVAARLNVPFDYVTIEFDEANNAGGHITVPRLPMKYWIFAPLIPQSYWHNRIMMLFGGISAQELWFQAVDADRAEGNAESDFALARVFVAKLPGVAKAERPAYLSSLREKTRQLVSTPEMRSWISRTADALYHCQRLDARMVKSFRDSREMLMPDGKSRIVWDE